MARLAIAGVIGALTLIPTVAMAQMDSRIGAPPMPSMAMPTSQGMPHGPGPMPQMPPMARPQMPPTGQPMPPMARPGPGGDRWGSVPGGWNAYRAPAYGYTLPRYWTAPTYYIADYRSFGLPAPAWGFGWSRYYDDMVLTDRWGRVYDWRDSRDMRGDGWRGDGGDYRPRKRDRSGIVGAIVGGAVGALTGNLIAGAGSRLAGSLIGGGVGALAGQAIDSGRIGGRDGYGRGDDYDRGHGGYRPSGPHWSMGESSGGYYTGCGCGGQTVTTTTTTTTYAAPVTTRRVSYVTEYVRMPAKRRVHYAPVRTKERYLGGS
jgi:Nickel/cobalt transporter regulator